MPPELDPPTGDPTPDPTGTPPAGLPPKDSGTPKGPAPVADPSSGDPPADLATITRERDAARREAARSKQELEKLQEKAKAAEDAEKSELARAQERATAAEQAAAEAAQRLRTTTLRADAQTEALRLGYLRPERAWREIDTDALDFDDAGVATNLAKLLEDELKARPELKAGPRPAGDAGGGDRGRPPVLTREQIQEKARTDPDWVNEHWSEVQEALGRAGR